ncbi:MAG: SMP-30/gluconolactonase/LRE family protein [Nocardioidaceae bacterium]
MRRLLLGVGVLLAPLLAVPAAASQPPSSIPIPDDFQPEGIAIGTGDTFYVTSLRDGDIYRGDLSTGEGSLLVDTSGKAAAGIRVDEARKLLFVAGGPGGHVYVYDSRDGSEVADIAVGPATAFTNDVALTGDAAYFTDTFSPNIYKLPYGNNGFGPPSTISVTGPASMTGPGIFGLNGIDATRDGRTLIVNHTHLGILALVDPDTGMSTQIPISGGSLVPDTLDGLQLEGRTVYVVQNFANSIAVVDLSGDLSSGVLDETITTPLFRVPATAALHGSTIAAINARFDLGLPPPFGPGAPPGTDFDVVLVRK